MLFNLVSRTIQANGVVWLCQWSCSRLTDVWFEASKSAFAGSAMYLGKLQLLPPVCLNFELKLFQFFISSLTYLTSDFKFRNQAQVLIKNCSSALRSPSVFNFFSIFTSTRNILKPLYPFSTNHFFSSVHFLH